MYREMEKAGLPAPEYRDVAFMLNATIRNGENVVDSVVDNVAENDVDVAATKKLTATERAILEHLRVSPELSANPIQTDL